VRHTVHRDNKTKDLFENSTESGRKPHLSKGLAPLDASPAKSKPTREETTKLTVWDSEEQFLSVGEVANRYTVSPKSIWRWLKTEPNFPKPIHLTKGTTR
jgi:predicted DNA-binding transcriptional regulator AlpA